MALNGIEDCYEIIVFSTIPSYLLLIMEKYVGELQILYAPPPLQLFWFFVNLSLPICLGGCSKMFSYPYEQLFTLTLLLNPWASLPSLVLYLCLLFFHL